MKEENNAEGLYSLKIDARHYFPDRKITRDVLEALRCRQYAAVLAFYLLGSTPQDRRRYAAEQAGKTGPTLPLAYQTRTGAAEPCSQTSS